MDHYIRRIFVFFLVSLLIIAGSDSIFAKEKVLVIGDYGTIGTLDATMSGNTQDVMLLRIINQSLLRYKFDTLELEGDLAEKWTISPDGLIYTFKLRDDVVWHKGFGKFNAKDVKFTFDRILDPKTGAPGRAEIINELKEVRIVDDHTVEFHLNYPFAPFIHILVGPRVSGIVNQKAVEKYGKDYSRNPIGTGPYILDSWTREQLTFVANKEFKQRQGPPKFDKILYKIIPDIDTLMMAMQRGDIDMVCIMPREKAIHDRLRASGINITYTRRPSTPQIQINVTKKPFDDVRVRKAIAHAIDKDALVKYVLSDMADRLDGPLPKGIFGYTESGVPHYEYNPGKAKELLAQAGYPNGIEINYDTSQSPSHLPLATAISDQLRKANITSKLVVTDVSTWWGKITKRSTDFTLNAMSWLADPHFTLKRYYHSGAGLNVSRYNKIDELLDKSGQEMNVKKRLEMYQKIQKQFMEDLPAIPLMDIQYPIAHKKNIAGVAKREFVLGIDLYPIQFMEK